MRAVNKVSTILALGLAMLLFRIGPAGAAVFEVHIDTSAIFDATAISHDAVMAFDFANSDDGSDHQLVISDFASDGSLPVWTKTDPGDCPLAVFPFTVDLCKAPPGASVTGTLRDNPPVTISDAGSSDNPISYYHAINLKGASYIRFRFEMSSVLTPIGALQESSESSDGFAFYLLNPGNPLDPEMNPGGDVLGPGPLVLYTFDGSCDTEFSEGSATCTEVRVPSVPEPGTVVLTVAAMLALISARWRASAVRRQSADRA